MTLPDLRGRLVMSGVAIYEPKASDGLSSQRLVQMSANVLLFAVGCGSAALAYSLVGVKCFVLPPIVGSLHLIIRLMQRPQSRS
jgi:hypothetical protein